MTSEESHGLCPFKKEPSAEARMSMGMRQPRACDGYRCELWIGDEETGRCALAMIALGLQNQHAEAG
ncbi:MAG: hypothetical protein R6V19_04445 [Armatimonadota bacterium]